MTLYEEEIKQLENAGHSLTYKPETAFYGSASIRLWKTLYNDFAPHKPVNLGFGGSSLAACVWLFERIFASYQPSSIIIYAGDNDLGDGRHPEEVVIFFKQLVVKIHQHFGDIPCYYISIKPSISRWNIVESLKHTNYLIESKINNLENWKFIDIYNPMINEGGCFTRELYDDNGLHLSPEGYKLWKKIILSKLSESW